MKRTKSSASGALLIDKAAGMTSYDVIRVLKRRFGFERIGHAGTLDPLATGLLVVLLGEATRLQSVVMAGRKTYEGMIRLGARTSSDDIDGAILEVDEERTYRFSDREELLRRVIERFSGPISQRPPAVSAVKQNGQRSYALARQGIDAELEERVVEIHSLKVAFCDADTLAYTVECSKGTYVRSLARDIGSLLGTFGCIASLRRLASGSFSVDAASSLEAIQNLAEAALPLHPLEALVGHLPAVRLPAREIALLQQGNQQPLLGLQGAAAELHALWSDSGEYCGLLERNASESLQAMLKVRYLRPPLRASALAAERS